VAKKYLKNNKGLVVAKTTDNLQLEKPLSNENYDIEVHNRNMDKIDSSIQEVKGKIDGLELVASNVKMQDGTSVEDTIQGLKTSVSTSASNLSSLQTRVDKLYGDNEKLSSEHLIKSYPGKYFSSATTEKDLNNIKYNLITYTTSADKLVNLPSNESGAAGMLEVTQTFLNNGVTQHIIQRFTNANTNTFYMRTYHQDSSTWTAWREL